MKMTIAKAVPMDDMEPDEGDSSEKSEYGDMDEMEVKCMYEDLMRAENIKQDPDKMKAVSAYATKQKTNIDKITGGAPKVKSVDDLRKKRSEITTGE